MPSRRWRDSWCPSSPSRRSTSSCPSSSCTCSAVSSSRRTRAHGAVGKRARKCRVTVEHRLGAVILAALVIYALSGGADYGGGMWDLLARGPRASRQRAAIEHAIGPIWEANHVWLILVIVVLFTAFPPAFATIMTALHIPMTAILLG